MTAFHSPPHPPTHLSSLFITPPPAWLSSSSPSTDLNYSMKKNDFPKQRHKPLVPWSESKIRAWQDRGISGRTWISVVWYSNQNQSHLMHIYMLEKVPCVRVIFSPKSERRLIGKELVNFPLLITNHLENQTQQQEELPLFISRGTVNQLISFAYQTRS